MSFSLLVQSAGVSFLALLFAIANNVLAHIFGSLFSFLAFLIQLVAFAIGKLVLFQLVARVTLS
jgi:hypothetical protein